MVPIVREAEPADAEGIAAVHVRSWRAAYRGLVAGEFLDRLSVPDRADTWRDRLVGGSREQPTFVTLSGGEIVGFVAAGPTRDPFADTSTGEVYALYVDPDAWRTGMGSSLLARAMEDLRARGYTSATLWVLTGNQIGRRFYERRGWRVEGARKPCPIGGVDLEEIRYRTEL